MKRAGYARPLSKKQLKRGVHSSRVGGRWEKMGRLQLDFLVEHGLTPDSCVLDVGCGALRAGIPLVGYLDPGRYYGIDINESLLEASYELELPSELRENSRATTCARPTASTATSASSSTSRSPSRSSRTWR